jgi:hypothetical protein
MSRIKVAPLILKPLTLPEDTWRAVTLSSLLASTVMQDEGPALVALVEAHYADRARKAAGGPIAAKHRQEKLWRKIAKAADYPTPLNPFTHPGWAGAMQSRIDHAPEVYEFVKDKTPCEQTLRNAQEWLLSQNPELKEKTLASRLPRSARATETASST